MKKTSAINLVLLGTVSAIALGACKDDDDKDALIYGTYSNIQECALNHGLTTCEEEYAAAQARHKASAPTYASKEACDAAHGGCYQQSANSPWIPLMIGYMMGGGHPSMPMYYGARERDDRRSIYSGSSYVGSGAYSPSYAGGANAGLGRSFAPGTAPGVSTGAVGSPAKVSPSAVNTVVAKAPSVSTSSTSVARGGFGGTGAGMSSGS